MQVPKTALQKAENERDETFAHQYSGSKNSVIKKHLNALKSYFETAIQDPQLVESNKEKIEILLKFIKQSVSNNRKMIPSNN